MSECIDKAEGLLGELRVVCEQCGRPLVISLFPTAQKLCEDYVELTQEQREKCRNQVGESPHVRYIHHHVRMMWDVMALCTHCAPLFGTSQGKFRFDVPILQSVLDEELEKSVKAWLEKQLEGVRDEEKYQELISYILVYFEANPEASKLAPSDIRFPRRYLDRMVAEGLLIDVREPSMRAPRYALPKPVSLSDESKEKDNTMAEGLLEE